MSIASEPPSSGQAEPSAKDPTWQQWGPYLAERQWGTVREDASADGRAWEAVTHDMARSFAYRWGEDGIGGLSDDRQRLCLALALWNGEDAILKERMFGLSNAEGNHGEDVKEVYHYLDNLPDHRYMRMRYRYPQRAFPYAALVAENARRSRQDPEYELADTGIFEGGRYFDVEIEIAKRSPTDLLVRYTAHNRGPDAATLHLLPTVWFRGDPAEPHAPVPRLSLAADDDAVLHADHPTLGRYVCRVEGTAGLNDEGACFLFTDNAANEARLAALGCQGRPLSLVSDTAGPAVYKDGIGERVVHGVRAAVRDRPIGTKAAAWRTCTIAAGGSATIRLHLYAADTGDTTGAAVFDRADADIAAARAAADAFYAARQDPHLDPTRRAVQRQAWAGLLWSKQFYRYDVRRWLQGDAGAPPLPAARLHGRNAVGWQHLNAHDVLLMPDTWEYPWFAAWDLAFHCIAIAPIDPALAKRQLTLLLHDRYMHPNGQLPAYEWNFSDVNPPVQALAAWKIYQRDAALTGTPDTAFLRQVLHRLMLNFTWWVNREDRSGNNIFEGGFLGLDNVGVFDRSQPLPGGGELEQADGTSWMAMYALNLMRIAMELAQDDPVYEDLAIKFSEHFFRIAGAIANVGGAAGDGLWDEDDGFYYDMIRRPDGSVSRLRLRTIAGLVPLLACEVLDDARLDRLQRLRSHLDRFLQDRPDLDALVSHWRDPSPRIDALPPGEDPPAPAAAAQRRHLFALLRGHRMKSVLARMLDEDEFLSPHGIRSVSKAYGEHAFDYTLGDTRYALHYTPAESDTGMFGGNSNWRGPVWMPLNFLILEALRRFHTYYGDGFRIECPTRSGTYRSLGEVADFLQQRLVGLFVPDAHGVRPGCSTPGECASAPGEPAALLFHEYFHGDTGRGLGASHQTGWTALIALL
ncbi:glucosidase [uncultured Xylophilus sp.]|uniref:MGH1-like glycoside hydrolase domain-containing protein n=1 Tax=uncultured Xylophilus sp. TaxID=296832 RepID=UPI0025F2600D|nr:glucosidase [uncultured Xylophilus sp.]